MFCDSVSVRRFSLFSRGGGNRVHPGPAGGPFSGQSKRGLRYVGGNQVALEDLQDLFQM